MTTVCKFFGALAGAALVGGICLYSNDQNNATTFKAEHDGDAQKMYEATRQLLSDRSVCKDCYWEAKALLEQVGYEYKHTVSWNAANSTYIELMTACDDIIHSRRDEIMHRHYQRLVTETVVKC
mgnify:FL=1